MLARLHESADEVRLLTVLADSNQRTAAQARGVGLPPAHRRPAWPFRGTHIGGFSPQTGSGVKTEVTHTYFFFAFVFVFVFVVVVVLVFIFVLVFCVCRKKNLLLLLLLLHKETISTLSKSWNLKNGSDHPPPLGHK